MGSKFGALLFQEGNCNAESLQKFLIWCGEQVLEFSVHMFRAVVMDKTGKKWDIIYVHSLINNMRLNFILSDKIEQ